MHFIGLDIHKKTISYCVKDVSGTVLSEGTVAATRAQMLMASGVVYKKRKVHKGGYCKERMETTSDISRRMKRLLAICRETIVRIGKSESALIRSPAP